MKELYKKEKSLLKRKMEKDAKRNLINRRSSRRSRGRNEKNKTRESERDRERERVLGRENVVGMR